MPFKSVAIATAVLVAFATRAVAQTPDPNFYIFLCFGQSNMEGAGRIEEEDRTVDERFQVLWAVESNQLDRQQGQWYPAVPPLCRENSRLSPADYFGRTLVEKLPANVRVGVINVSVAGTKIELFDEATRAAYAADAEPWKKGIIDQYGGDPYGRLVEMAKLAQQAGVIKGVLLHQGESNTNDRAWPAKVKTIYERLLGDLSLEAATVPLVVGELVHEDQNGACASMNKIIATLPETIPTAHVVSSSRLASRDRLHFTSEAYREFGRRYAAVMLPLLGVEVEAEAEPAVEAAGQP